MLLMTTVDMSFSFAISILIFGSVTLFMSLFYSFSIFFNLSFGGPPSVANGTNIKELTIGYIPLVTDYFTRLIIIDILTIEADGFLPLVTLQKWVSLTMGLPPNLPVYSQHL